MPTSPYLHEVKQNLPRLLALFDSDGTSNSYGLGDRFHWAWGLIDFGNGTFQGAAHGLARLWRSGLWPYDTDPERFLARIDALFAGTTHLTRHDGSLEEAFPNEGSYCVTALVAFDLLCAMDLLSEETDSETQQRWQATVAPLIDYLLKADETHALISNHLATAAAALSRWHVRTGNADALKRARQLLDRILNHQSAEGWFLEYEGADPGYQTYCTYYLADVHKQHPDWNLSGPLQRSLKFLWHFAHPDGSFGGLYGSRCTRFYCPAGILALAKEIPEAAALATFMETSIAKQRVVTLSAIDEPNLVPMFNAYCWAAALEVEQQPASDLPKLPALRDEPSRIRFPETGLWIDSGPRHYSIINCYKGGVVAHFVKEGSVRIDAGVVIKNGKGQLGSTQAFTSDNRAQVNGNQILVEARFTAMPKKLPTPFQFVLLRLLCLTLFKCSLVRRWAKKRLVNLLITRRQPWPGKNLREITLGPNLSITDHLNLSAGYCRMDIHGPFVAIHMASQGYWQIQDELDERS